MTLTARAITVAIRYAGADGAKPEDCQVIDGRRKTVAGADAVSQRIQVNGDCSDFNGPHQRLRDACERQGYDFRTILRNADRHRTP